MGRYTIAIWRCPFLEFFDAKACVRSRDACFRTCDSRVCPSLYVFHHFHVLFEDEKTLKDKSQREKYAPQFLDVRVVFFVRFKVCRPFEARECGRERERERESERESSSKTFRPPT